MIERRLMATHPPATAGGTDLFQVRLLTFEARPKRHLELSPHTLHKARKNPTSTDPAHRRASAAETEATLDGDRLATPAGNLLNCCIATGRTIYG